MEEVTLEFMIASSVIGLLDLLAITTLIFYDRHAQANYLRLGIAALCAEVVDQLAMLGAVLMGQEAFLMLSVVARIAFAILVFAAVCRLTKFETGKVLIPLSLVATILVGVVLLLMGTVPAWWMVGVETPALLLMLTAGTVLLGKSRSPAYLTMAALVALHALLCLLPLFVPAASMSLFVVAVDAIAAVMIAFGLILTIAENLIGDISARDEQLLQVEQENRRLELQFAQAQKHESLGVMAAGIAHDFNNMLTSILGYTSLAIKKLPPDSEVRKDLYMVMSGGRQAVEITSQMLVYAGKGNLEFESIYISQMVDNMSSLINSLVPRRIHLRHNIQRDLPLIKGDSILLGQVLTNLVGNAVDATGDREGEIEITTGVSNVTADMLKGSLFSDSHEPGAYVFMRVSDNGIGMTADQVEKIFDPFYSEKNQGKGLGLSSISGIVRQHRGFMRVESQPKQGATFTIYLPVVSYNDPAQPGSPTQASLSGRERILLADDDVRIRSLIEALLEGEGYEVVSAVDGREAMDEIEKAGQSFRAFILDCTMPKIEGPELYREIRASGLDAPVVMISGYHEDQVVEDSRKDPQLTFLQKPFSVDQLLETLSDSLVSQRV